MRARKLSALCTALLLVASFVVPMPGFASAKRRIAIMPFDYGTSIDHRLYSKGMEKGISDMLVTKLVNDGTYTVVDRDMMDKILTEQNFSVSDRADPATAAKIGKALSVDAIITGKIVEFGFENHNVGVGGVTGYIPYVGGFGHLAGAGHHSGKVHVAVDARLIDVNTMEVLAACHGVGDSHRGATNIAGIYSGTDDFASSIGGEAVAAAVEEIGTQMIAAAAKIPDNQSLAAQNVKGKVADVTGTQVIVNVGTNNGIVKGDHLTVDRIYKTVKDPSTGAVLKELSNTIAVIKISDVDKSSSTGSIVKGNGVRVGDDVKKTSTDLASITVQPVTMTATGAIIPKKGK